MRGFILTTKGDLQSKIDYTFRIYDQNDDNQISGEEIQKMANVGETRDRQTIESNLRIVVLHLRRSSECSVVTEQRVTKLLS